MEIEKVNVLGIGLAFLLFMWCRSIALQVFKFDEGHADD